ncbi:hypothetical protein BU15DRAFT_68327 [Melanogaster broomeanus]|nr:hypothetical protein BU15DRAFT_68327 [Melanogaster broomeanus]
MAPEESITRPLVSIASLVIHVHDYKERALQLSSAIKMKSRSTHPNSYPARFLPYRRYPKSYSYPCLTRVPLQRSHAALFDHNTNVFADYSASRSLLYATEPMVRNGTLPVSSGYRTIGSSHTSDAGSPMQSVRSPSVDSEDCVHGYLDGMVEPIAPVQEVLPRRLARDNEHIRHLMYDVRRTVHRASCVKRRLTRQYNMVDVALCDEIESRINIAIGMALTDLTSHLDVDMDIPDCSDMAAGSTSVRHDSPAAGKHQVDITTPKAISAGVLRATVRWITKAVWHGSVGMVRFGGQHVCAALSPREPATLTIAYMQLIPIKQIEKQEMLTSNAQAVPVLLDSNSRPLIDDADAWRLVLQCAEGQLTFVELSETLTTRFRKRFNYADWSPVFTKLFAAWELEDQNASGPIDIVKAAMSSRGVSFSDCGPRVSVSTNASADAHRIKRRKVASGAHVSRGEVEDGGSSRPRKRPPLKVMTTAAAQARRFLDVEARVDDGEQTSDEEDDMRESHMDFQYEKYPNIHPRSSHPQRLLRPPLFSGTYILPPDSAKMWAVKIYPPSSVPYVVTSWNEVGISAMAQHKLLPGCVVVYAADPNTFLHALPKSHSTCVRTWTLVPLEDQINLFGAAEPSVPAWYTITKHGLYKGDIGYALSYDGEAALIDLLVASRRLNDPTRRRGDGDIGQDRRTRRLFLPCLYEATSHPPLHGRARHKYKGNSFVAGLLLLKRKKTEVWPLAIPSPYQIALHAESMMNPAFMTASLHCYNQQFWKPDDHVVVCDAAHQGKRSVLHAISRE